MAKSKLIYVAAAPNYWERIINATGKKERGKTGYRYALTDQKGQLLATGITEQVSDQMAAEAYGVFTKQFNEPSKSSSGVSKFGRIV